MAGGVRPRAPRAQTWTAPGGPITSASLRRPARLPGVLAAVPALAMLLTGCAVEAVDGDIADQQLCVAAQPAAEAVRARGSGTAGADGVPDLAELAGRARDAQLRSTLTELGEAYAAASGDAPGSEAWAEADRVVETLDQVCQRLSAF